MKMTAAEKAREARERDYVEMARQAARKANDAAKVENRK